MIFETHILEPPLKDHIESVFHFKGFRPDHSMERVVPTGHLFIIFELDGFTRHTFNNATLKPNGDFRKVWISGMHKDYLSISAHQESEMLVVQFKTSGAYPFLQIPIVTLNNRVVNGQEILGTEILEVREKLLATTNSIEKFKIVEAWLLGGFDASKSTPQEIISVLGQLKSKPITDGKEIIASYPNSQKHLIDQFKKYFGLTPKVFHRIFRFNEILKQIQDKKLLNWAAIAYEFGYADQSHFIKEFKEFSGFNPQEYINADYHKDEPNFFPLDREG